MVEMFPSAGGSNPRSVACPAPADERDVSR
jgi:hypothetical protein